MSECLPERPIRVSPESIRVIWSQQMRTIMECFRAIRDRLESLEGLPVLWPRVSEAVAEARPGNAGMMSILAEWDSANPEASSVLMRAAAEHVIPNIGTEPWYPQMEQYVIRAALRPHLQENAPLDEPVDNYQI